MSSKDLPENTNNKVVIKAVNFTFDKKAYSADHLKVFLTKDDFEEIISEINKLISKSFYTKRENETTSIGGCTIFVGIGSLLLTLVYILLLVYSAKEDTDNNTSNILFIVSIICMCGVLILIFLLSVMTYISKIGKMRTLEEIIKNNIEQYLGYINNYFESYLEWVYNAANHYIEINILDMPNVRRDNVIEECDEEREQSNNSISRSSPDDSSQVQVNTERQLINESQDNFERKKKNKRINHYSMDSMIKAAGKHGRSASMMDKVNIKNKLK